MAAAVCAAEAAAAAAAAAAADVLPPSDDMRVPMAVKLLGLLALWLLVAAYLCVFAAVMMAVEADRPDATGRACTAAMDRMGTALYFGMTTLTSVGMGDVTPASPLGKLLLVPFVVAGVPLVAYVSSRTGIVLLGPVLRAAEAAYVALVGCVVPSYLRLRRTADLGPDASAEDRRLARRYLRYSLRLSVKGRRAHAWVVFALDSLLELLLVAVGAIVLALFVLTATAVFFAIEADVYSFEAVAFQTFVIAATTGFYQLAPTSDAGRAFMGYYCLFVFVFVTFLLNFYFDAVARTTARIYLIHSLKFRTKRDIQRVLVDRYTSGNKPLAIFGVNAEGPQAKPVYRSLLLHRSLLVEHLRRIGVFPTASQQAAIVRSYMPLVALPEPPESATEHFVARLGAGLACGVHEAEHVVDLFWDHGAHFVLLAVYGAMVAALTVVGALFLWLTEYDHEHSLCDGTAVEWSFGFSLYFAVIEITTIGFGEVLPVGLVTRFVAVAYLFFLIPLYLIFVARFYALVVDPLFLSPVDVVFGWCVGCVVPSYDRWREDQRGAVAPSAVLTLLYISIESVRTLLPLALISGTSMFYVALFAWGMSALENWSLVDGLYFSFVAYSTLGFGDLVPSSGTSRALTAVFAVLFSVLLVALGSKCWELAATLEDLALRLYVGVERRIATMTWTSTPPSTTGGE
jgi:hypothetical protein